MTSTLVLGGPGCGKTTHLLSVVEEALSRGVRSTRIGYVAFTRKAANEARERVMRQFELTEDDIPFFSTLHSLAFKQLSVVPAQVMSPERFARFAEAEGYDFTAQDSDEFATTTTSDRALAAISFARLTRRNLRDVCADFECSPDIAHDLRRDLVAFKTDQALVDYTDMIETFVERGAVPAFDLLIVDEAQDLSALQWEMVAKLAHGVPDVYFAGDDDQAIYAWAGADLERFLSLSAKRIVLPVSHRLKSNVYALTQRVVRGVRDRFEKAWSPHAQGGTVETFDRIVDVDTAAGSTFVLARNGYLLRGPAGFLWDAGIPFLSRSRDGSFTSSLDRDDVRAILTWEALRKDKQRPGDEITNLYRFLGANVDPVFLDTVFDSAASYALSGLRDAFGLRTTADWMTALRIPPSVAHHVQMAKIRGESLIDRPRVTLSTIHGVKGGEADHVVILSDVSARCYDALQREPSDESRVFFVGASRARERVSILSPTTARYYDLVRGEA